MNSYFITIVLLCYSRIHCTTSQRTQPYIYSYPQDISFTPTADLPFGATNYPATIRPSRFDQKVELCNFSTLMAAIGSHLNFSETLQRALGLELEKKISKENGAAARLKARLTAQMPAKAEAEIDVLHSFLSEQPAKAKPNTTSAASKIKTTFRMTVPAGPVRCLAQDGRIEFRADRDFSGEGREKLESTLAAFFSTLGDG